VAMLARRPETSIEEVLVFIEWPFSLRYAESLNVAVVVVC
jgi:hypothetical protein